MGTVVETQIVIHLRGLDQRPDLRADRRQLGRVHRRDHCVLVEKLLQLGDVAIRFGPGHRRDQVVDDGGVRPALGLGALAGVVDQERVDQRHRPDRGVRPAGTGHADVLAGQPFQVAVLAQVHDGVRAELLLQPAIGRQIMVRGRHFRVVVDRDRVLTEPAGRLDQHDDVPGLQGGQHDLAVRAGRPVDEQFARRRTPGLRHRGGQLGRQLAQPAGVPGRRDPHRIARELFRGQPFLVLTARRDQRVDQRVARRGVRLLAVDRLQRCQPGQRVVTIGPEVVAGLAHGAEQPDRGHRGVQADRVADPGMLRRVGRQHDRDLALRRRDVPEPGVRHRDAGHPCAAFRVRDIPRQPSASVCLKENGTVMIRPSNSGTATWVATSRGERPSLESAQASRDHVRHSPCRIGMSSAASAVTSHASSSPPAVAVAGLVPPAASTVTINASKVASSAKRSSGAPRKDEQKIGTATAPCCACTASARACTNAVFPDA